ncbi:MAG: glycosyltransferase family 4 protein [Phycisphaerae bacterium]
MAFKNPKRGRKMLDRYCRELDPANVTSFPSLIRYERANGKGFPSMFEFFAWLSKLYAERILRQGWDGADTLFGFVRNIHPDLCRAAKNDGLLTIGDQIIAPYVIEEAEERIQRERFPGWTAHPALDTKESFAAYEWETWKYLDHITCASAYVREGLLAQGIDAERITVIPYPLDLSEFPIHDRSGRTGVVTVGFVGAVGLRKGAPYFAEVARRLAGKSIRFMMIGPLHLSAMGLAEIKPHVDVPGPVPRSRVLEQLRSFDILLFPSTCEGSAGSVMEAMATGLPVVTTPNSGSLVEPGVSGFLAGYDEIDRMAEAIETLATNAEKRRQMGLAARAAVERCTIDAYSRDWTSLMQSLSPVHGPVKGQDLR